MPITITPYPNSEGIIDRLKIWGELRTAVHLVVEATQDIADKIEETAKAEAPMGETGQLKAHPVDVNVSHGERIFGRGGEQLSFGESIETRAPTFGGGFAVRGAGGRFVRSTPFTQAARPDRFTPERIEITVARVPEHAIWVHNGTGIYGPRHSPIKPVASKVMHWTEDDVNIFAKSTKGQPANPYLQNAFVIINRTYIPARVERLRAEIRAL